MQSQKEDKRIVFLDYLRIVAFLTVLIGHKFYDYLIEYTKNLEAHATPKLFADLLIPVVQGGGAGVILFFLISGYIITHVLQFERTGEFLIKRMFRIYPLYFVAVLIQYTPLIYTGQFPDLLNLLKQLLLVGDFFGTSYTLNGVEWTLRIEMLFYFYMAIIRKLNLFNIYTKVIPYIYAITTISLTFLAPIPSDEIWSKGYVTIYAPFLLLGSMYYLLEKKLVGQGVFISFLLLLLIHYFSLIEEYQLRWINSHFVIIAIVIFSFCWLLKNYFTITPLVSILSDMTYAVYLFHNWFFDYIKKILLPFKFDFLHIDIQALIVLFLFCYLMVKLIEKPGIRLGKKVTSKIFLKKTNVKSSGQVDLQG